MAARRILIIQGHPDPQCGHFCHALAARYAEGASDERREKWLDTLQGLGANGA
jgi:putative NADPH-quinone reductase